MKPKVSEVLGECWFADTVRAITMEFHFDDEIKKALLRPINDAPKDWISIEYGRYTLKYDYNDNVIFVG